MIPNARKSLFVTACVAGLAALAGSLATGQPTKDTKTVPATPKAPAQPGQPEMKLPPGWTESDMQACTEAGTPGKMHDHLAKGVGVWQGQTTMWMGPGMDPMPKSECTSTVTVIMDGRYTKCDMVGEIPGMGAFNGFGITGFDNVSQRFVGTWIDNHSTGIMNGVGDLSADGKVLTWSYTMNCPITRKPATVRQIETYTSPTTMSFEMFTTDPKSGKEYKCMHVDFTKKN